jgi:ABC-type lipoprotein release transport system permease subunit
MFDFYCGLMLGFLLGVIINWQVTKLDKEIKERDRQK